MRRFLTIYKLQLRVLVSHLKTRSIGLTSKGVLIMESTCARATFQNIQKIKKACTPFPRSVSNFDVVKASNQNVYRGNEACRLLGISSIKISIRLLPPIERMINGHPVETLSPYYRDYTSDFFSDLFGFKHNNKSYLVCQPELFVFLTYYKIFIHGY